MDQNTGDKKGASLGEANRLGQCYQTEKAKEKNFLKKANHRLSWGVGIIFALVPVIFCGVGIVLHSDNEAMVSNFKQFTSEFFSSGSFLWVSITILVMSLLELLLYGFKKKITGKARIFCEIFVIVSVAFVILGVYMYFDNIGNPINEGKMYIISGVAFALFAISSGIISFKMAQEV